MACKLGVGLGKGVAEGIGVAVGIKVAVGTEAADSAPQANNPTKDRVRTKLIVSHCHTARFYQIGRNVEARRHFVSEPARTIADQIADILPGAALGKRARQIQTGGTGCSNSVSGGIEQDNSP